MFNYPTLQVRAPAVRGRRDAAAQGGGHHRPGGPEPLGRRAPAARHGALPRQAGRRLPGECVYSKSRI